MIAQALGNSVEERPAFVQGRTSLVARKPVVPSASGKEDQPQHQGKFSGHKYLQ
jgi:hypothetical protein